MTVTVKNTVGTGIEWISSIPSHWTVRDLKWCCSEKKTRNLGNSVTNVLSLSYGKIVGRDVESNHGLLPASFETYQIVEPGDIVLRLTDLQNDKRSLRVGQVEEGGIITSAYLCLRPGDELEARFVYYLLHAYDKAKVFYGFGGGVRQSMKFDDLCTLSLVYPPLTTQRTIVNFLDRKTAAIDALIEKKQRLLGLLKEKRAALISQAVTKGLDPKVPMKDSGIPWIGEIPAHWEVKQLRRVVSKIEQGWSPQCHSHPVSGDEWGVLKAGCTAGGHMNLGANKALPEDLAPRPSLAIRSGDVIVSRASGSPSIIGTAAIVPQTNKNLMISDKLFRLSFAPEVAVSSFFVAALGGRSARAQIENAISGAEGLANNLPQSRLKEVLLACPPAFEQAEIARHLSGFDRGSSVAGERIQEQITKLQEYREALITAAVTGQVEVSE